MKNKDLQILETTLRDGSYAINFGFTSQDTALICKELEGAGFDFIEIGHGVGFNASNTGYGKAVQTDEEYCKAAASVLKKAKYGMFCIPGIARLDDVDMASNYGMGFIRVGTNVTEVSESKEFIKRAKKYGMFVAANFMKSYALTPKEFAQNVLLAQDFGADLVYIVDSAGGMFPENIKTYFDAIREVTSIPLGFHGHDNLSLAVSNSLASAKLGIEFIDTSLQGLGRSAGNAATEIMLAVLLKQGFVVKQDLLKVLDIGHKYIQPLINAKMRQPLDIVGGYAEFHSSYMHYIQKYAAKYKINPAILIIELCKVDKVNVDEEKLEKIAQKIKQDDDIYLGKYDFNRYIGNEQEK